MSANYDVIVVGCGGVGSAALHHLARAGAKVLGVDRFPAAHDRGSSHGETRIIRLSYFEHPDYVPLLRRAYELWAELERESEQVLYHQTGLLQVGPPGGVVVPGVLKSAAEHSLDVEQLERDELARRFPGFEVASDHVALFEARAGVLQVEDCVLANLRLAQSRGAELRTDVSVERIEPEAGGVRLLTNHGELRAKRVVVTAGAWASELLRSESLELEVVRKSLFWFDAPAGEYSASQAAPAFFFETADGMYYGFPAFASGELKLAEHTGGSPVCDPLNVDREVWPEEEGRITRFLRAHLPGVKGARTRHATCLYTRTPDEHFVIDALRDAPQIVYAAGLSGHGFKFASVLGELLADMALERGSALDTTFLRASRFEQ